MVDDGRPKALVLGATGSIGRALIRDLLADPGPEQVRAVAAVRDAPKGETFRNEGVDTVHRDLNEPESIAASLAGIDRVFLLTGYSVEMLAQSKFVVDAAKKAGVTHIVPPGAYATDDTTVIHLGWHQFAERYIEWSGLVFTHLRPNYFMQNLLGYAGVRWVALSSTMRKPNSF
jgi:NAD(P)H dehydrogenase (quinone)